MKTKAKTKKDESNYVIIHTWFSSEDGEKKEGVDLLMATDDPWYEDIVKDHPEWEIEPFNEDNIDVQELANIVQKGSLMPVSSKDNDLEKL